MRYFEQAGQLLPNSSRIPEALAYVTRRQGQWDRSESYFNEAERLDPLNLRLLTEHAESYVMLRRFPEALRKFDQVLNITADDVGTLAQPENPILIGDLALINVGLGDKATALALAKRGMAVRPIEKDALEGAAPIEFLAG